MQHRNLMISDIEILEGYLDEPSVDEESSLSIWYSEIRHSKISELTDGDIAKAIRQRVFLSYTAQEAIKRLLVDPTIGFMYVGEVISSLSEINLDFWPSNLQLKEETINLLRLTDSRQFDWITDEDKREFYSCVDKLKGNIS
jgi:hypothetical protein